MNCKRLIIIPWIPNVCTTISIYIWISTTSSYKMRISIYCSRHQSIKTSQFLKKIVQVESWPIKKNKKATIWNNIYKMKSALKHHLHFHYIRVLIQLITYLLDHSNPHQKVLFQLCFLLKLLSKNLADQYHCLYLLSKCSRFVGAKVSLHLLIIGGRNNLLYLISFLFDQVLIRLLQIYLRLLDLK